MILHIREEVDYLLDAEKPHFAAWIWARNISIPWQLKGHPNRLEAVTLFSVVVLGLPGMARHLILKRPQDVIARCGRYGILLPAGLFHGHFELSLLLLQYGANLRARNKEGETPLHLALRRGYLDLMWLLLDQGADVDAQDKNCSTPLHAALCSSHPEAARLLLEYGASVHACYDPGSSLRKRNDLQGKDGSTSVL